MRRTITTLAVFTVLLPCMSACAATPQSPNAAVPASPTTGLTPIDVVRRSADTVKTTPFHLTASSSLGVTEGDIDLVAKRAVLTSQTGTKDDGLTSETRLIGNDLYLRLAGTAWIHFDASRLGPYSSTLAYLRLRSVTGILSGVSDVTETSPGQYSGTSDLTKAVAATPQADRGDKPIQKLVTISKYGNPVAVQAPPSSDVTEATPDQYRLYTR